MPPQGLRPKRRGPRCPDRKAQDPLLSLALIPVSAPRLEFEFGESILHSSFEKIRHRTWISGRNRDVRVEGPFRNRNSIERFTP
jgi:hypothetical protein